MKQREYWINVIDDWFEKRDESLIGPNVQASAQIRRPPKDCRDSEDTAPPSSDKTPPELLPFIEVVTHGCCVFRGKALYIEDRCLVVCRCAETTCSSGSKTLIWLPSAFVDWDEIIAIRIVCDQPDALCGAISAIGEVLSGAGD